MESNPEAKSSNDRKSESSEKEIEQLKELVSGEPDAFCILVGAMKWNESKNRFESGAFSDPDENSKLSTGMSLATGGKDRMLAAAELHKAFPQSLLVPMSKTRDETKPTYAHVTQGELITKGVDPDQILLEEESVSTVTEFIEAAKLWKQNGWSNIAFISSNWHLPRSKALLNHIENFANNHEEEVLLKEFANAIQSGNLLIQFLGSTEVLKIRSPHYEKFFEELDSYPALQTRVEHEQNGLNQIASGEYGGKKLMKRIWNN